MENHDAAYHTWRDAGVRQRILVHIDAHHDMWGIKDGTPITIANFICPALKEDLVREVFWVVPDASWETARARGALFRHLKAIVKGYPGPSPRLKVANREMFAAVLGRPLHLLPLHHLPRIEESVLLDLDVDYLVIPRASYGETDRHGLLPWCWPDGLVARLSASGLRTDLVTIAYSVEGGYTPLKWKYLGDELALRLRQPDPDVNALQGMALMREGALAAHRGDRPGSEAFFQHATRLLPDFAAPCYHLAHLYLEEGRENAAREFYRQALARDPSYRTAYNSAGIRCYWDRRFREARQEHQRTLALDADDPYAHLGLGQIAAREKRWSEAEASLRTALALDKTLPDAWRVLGKVLAFRNRHREAILAYQQSLMLVLRGHMPLTDIITTQPPIDQLIDPHHCAIHVELARLYEATGALAKAITSYRLGIAGGEDGSLLRCRLVRLHLRHKQWRQAAQEICQVGLAIAVGAWQAGRRGIAQVNGALRRHSEILRWSWRGPWRRSTYHSGRGRQEDGERRGSGPTRPAGATDEPNK
jgi:tetratricopeptide (TPR) repeat protein